MQKGCFALMIPDYGIASVTGIPYGQLRVGDLRSAARKPASRTERVKLGQRVAAGITSVKGQ